MKNVYRKLDRRELLVDHMLFALTTLLWAGLLFLQIIRIANGSVALDAGVRLLVFSVIALFVIVILAGGALYRKSMSYIVWYKGILDACPIPLIVTDKDVEWQQVNRATRKLLSLKEDSKVTNLNSRHLVAEDGSIMNKIWPHKGTTYRTEGNRLYCGGKDAGYLIVLNNMEEMAAAAPNYPEMVNKMNLRFKRLSITTRHFCSCAASLSEHAVWQADLIAGLSEIVTEVASGNLDDPQVLARRINMIKEDMQQHAEVNRIYSEKIGLIIQELNTFYDSESFTETA